MVSGIQDKGRVRMNYSGFHPPVNWVPDRIDPSKISPIDFFHRYIRSRTPVIFTKFPQDFLEASIDWTTVKAKAGKSIVKVEGKDDGFNQFGSGRTRQRMTIDELDQVLPLGNHYLTTQYHTEDDQENLSPSLIRIQEYCQPPLTSLINDFPHRPDILGHLAPQQVNIWVGYQKGLPTSSGLHHDFHDNLYLLISGNKSFTLYSPKDFNYMYTYGQADRVWENGLIQYSPGMRGDGAFMGHVLSWKLGKAEATLEELEAQGMDTTDAEELVDKAMDDFMQQRSLMDSFDEEDDDNSDEDEDSSDYEEADVGKKRKLSPLNQASKSSKRKPNQDSPEQREPDSFSRIDIKTLHAETSSPQFPLFSKATQTKIELSQGEALYLPAGWFHEVSSSCADGKEGIHMAFNYWMCPPTTNDFEHPYEDSYWEDSWKELSRFIKSMDHM